MTLRSVDEDAGMRDRVAVMSYAVLLRCRPNVGSWPG